MDFQILDKTLPTSEKYRVFADGKELKVIKDVEYDYVYIFSNDIAAIDVKVAERIDTVALRPSRRAKKFTLENDTVSFLMSRADYYCLEINGDLKRPLLLFCEEKIEKQVYDGQNLIYFKPNTYYKTGVINPESNTVIFIDEGAVIEGKISASKVNNVRILGNGIIAAQTGEFGSAPNIDFLECENIEINGVTVIGYHNWNVRTWRSKNILIENLKILAHEIWSDGLDIVSSENVVIRHIFVKNEDDCVCIKSSSTKGKNYEGKDVRNVLVEDCVLWSGPRGNSLEIGYETNNSFIENIYFRNVDVIHRQTQENKFHRSVIAIHNAGNAVVRNVTYENIYAEETEENFINIAHMHEPDWGMSGGVIEGIRLRNVQLAGGELRPSFVKAVPYKATKTCVTKDITFEGLKILGKEIKSAEDAVESGFFIDPKAENVKFI